MAIRKKNAKRGRPANPNTDKNTKGKKPLMIHLPKKLHARLKLACLALSTNMNSVATQLFEEWVASSKTKKAIKSVIDIDADDDDEEEEVEEEEAEDNEDEEEEEEDEDEDEDEDE